MVEYRDGLIAERDRAAAALRAEFEKALDETQASYAGERDRFMQQIEAQQRIVAYRGSVRWWLRLPFVRAFRAWNRIRGA